MKPKANRTEPALDRCQTPGYGVAPLLPYLRRDWVVWEPAAGEGMIVDTLNAHGNEVIRSDVLDGQDFYQWRPAQPWDVLITNPPYSHKFSWLERCYDLGKPFALLVPVEMIGAQKAQRLMARHGCELLLLDKRVNFKMPSKGWDSSAQFPVMWLCWRLLPAPIVYGRVVRATLQMELFHDQAAA